MDLRHMPRDSRDIAFFVLGMLAALAVFSFVWADIRIGELKGSYLQSSAASR